MTSQLVQPPFQRLALGREARLARQEQGLAVQIREPSEVWNTSVQQVTDMPFQVGAGCDQMPIHRPVHVGRERQAVARVVVAGRTEGVDTR